jgi:hypothetical protein
MLPLAVGLLLSAHLVLPALLLSAGLRMPTRLRLSAVVLRWLFVLLGLVLWQLRLRRMQQLWQ